MLSTLVAFVALALSLALGTGAVAAVEPDGAVYTMTNDTAGNRVLVFNRRADGMVEAPVAFPTGGLGSGGSLGNQNGLILDPGNRWLFAVNAGSHEISVFGVTATGLELIETVDSGGFRPVSIALHDTILYVLNAGGNIGQSDNITGFRVRFNGRLAPLPDSTRSLSAAVTDPAQASFTLDGTVLVVTEKATNRILTYRVRGNGLLREPTVFDSAGPTPFGFAVGKRGQLFVSEAFGGAPNASAVSSYLVSRTGNLQVISPSVETTQTAVCWVVVSNDGRVAFTTNTGSGTLSTYNIDFQGSLELRAGIAGETGAGSGPLDLTLTNNGRFLYALARLGGSIEAFRVSIGGNLTPLQSIAIPTTANGLAAR
jgi:6-phosphogluconolactonase (cycloisomerase 2 family)